MGFRPRLIGIAVVTLAAAASTGSTALAATHTTGSASVAATTLSPAHRDVHLCGDPGGDSGGGGGGQSGGGTPLKKGFMDPFTFPVR